MTPASPLQARLIHAETFLLQHAALWQPAPFYQLPDWATGQPELYNALLALTEDKLYALEHNTTALAKWLGNYFPELVLIPSLIAFPRATGVLKRHWPTGFEWDIPGRKWAQIEAFASVLQPQASTLLDWCAGKGYLSRSVAFQYQHPVIALEWNADLCESATALNQKHKLAVTINQQDVLAADVTAHVTPVHHCIALHACGGLHLQLMHVACQQNAPALSFSPCCYHLINTPTYVPLSCIDNSVLQQRLTLTREQLRLAVQETVTANGHARRLRDRKSAWRLGFKQLVSSQGQSHEMHLPSLPDRYFHGTFAEFCRSMLKHSAIPLQISPNTDYEDLERAGWVAHQRVQRLELVRHAFRRVLEVWLCLDRACWLESQGYDVSVSEFCDTQVTPRNILIEARKSAHHQYRRLQFRIEI